MNLRKIFVLPALAILAASSLSSCLGNDDDSADYAEWIAKNEKYLTDKEAETDDSGKKVYERIVPSWCPGAYVLATWHNDRSKTEGNLVPMDNSTVDVIYECSYVDGTMIDKSYSNTTYGDSVYRCMPNENIVGFWTMLTHMHVGDSVTCVIPSNAGYGASGSVIPYSTLIYHMKLKRIHAYETPSKK
ncbi:MAG: FKBP-type peptidyl-prolyl cis-trans isomerase [Muribaculaceae bacterium]|nr:FKBP-type peptidyl-prolyl cis-trans isomerase [Muribaculaceae bacterium]